MPDKGVKVDQKIPTKEIEKQSTKMQSQVKLKFSKKKIFLIVI
jgi:hypothetical protein